MIIWHWSILTDLIMYKRQIKKKIAKLGTNLKLRIKYGFIYTYILFYFYVWFIVIKNLHSIWLVLINILFLNATYYNILKLSTRYDSKKVLIGKMLLNLGIGLKIESLERFTGPLIPMGFWVEAMFEWTGLNEAIGSSCVLGVFA